MSKRISSQRFRQRKLSLKQNLPVLREKDAGKYFDDDGLRNIPRVETGVEKGEEVEHHLQAVISAAQEGGGISSTYIPTPATTLSTLQYDTLYPPRFKQPHTYIKFSSTIEECMSTAYCMDEEDEEFLKALNANRRAGNQCSEDQFEQVMDALEEVTKVKQPFASLDPETPVLPLAELESGFEDLGPDTRKFIPEIYEHWKSRRKKRGNQTVMPSLKFERNETVDEADPYVCFRRREIRQTRKARGRDTQVGDKLKKLRTELEMARQLTYLVSVRQRTRKQQLGLDRQIFEQRKSLRDIMRSLGIKDGDMDLLIDQPPTRSSSQTAKQTVSKASADSASAPSAKQAAAAARISLQRQLEPDMLLYEEILAKREQQVGMFISESIEKHRAWNHGYVDFTWRPITPPREPEVPSLAQFCSATITDYYLPTPPLSVSSRNGMPIGEEREADQDVPPALTPISGPITPDYPKNEEWASSRVMLDQDDTRMCGPRIIYRRRMARGGRMVVDRKLAPPGVADTFGIDPMTLTTTGTGSFEMGDLSAGLESIGLIGTVNEDGQDEAGLSLTSLSSSSLVDPQSTLTKPGIVDDRVMDRYRYDRDSDDEDLNMLGYNVQYVDPYSANSIKYRALMGASMARDMAAAQMQQLQQQQAQQQQLAQQQQQQQQLLQLQQQHQGVQNHSLQLPPQSQSQSQSQSQPQPQPQPQPPQQQVASQPRAGGGTGTGAGAGGPGAQRALPAPTPPAPPAMTMQQRKMQAAIPKTLIVPGVGAGSVGGGAGGVAVVGNDGSIANTNGLAPNRPLVAIPNSRPS